MDKQVLTSVKASEPTGRYVAGILKNGKLLYFDDEFESYHIFTFQCQITMECNFKSFAFY